MEKTSLLPDWLLTKKTGKLRNSIHAAICVIIMDVLAGIICKRISLKLLNINCTDSSGPCMDEQVSWRPVQHLLLASSLVKLFLKETLLSLHLQRFGFSAFGGGLKGNPVQIGSYPRSCKKPLQTSPPIGERLGKSKIVEDLPLPRMTGWEGFNKALSQKTCHIKPTTFSFRVKGMRCKGRRTWIFLSLYAVVGIILFLF